MAYDKMLNFCHEISFGIEFAVRFEFAHKSFTIYVNYKILNEHDT